MVPIVMALKCLFCSDSVAKVYGVKCFRYCTVLLCKFLILNYYESCHCNDLYCVGWGIK